jgi:hypothetical protein
LYSCEIWFITKREEHRLRIFEKRGLTSATTREKVTGGWRKLHNEKFNDLYLSQMLG